MGGYNIPIPQGATVGPVPIPEGATIGSPAAAQKPSLLADPRAFLAERIAELDAAAQHQVNQVNGPEAEGKGLLSRAGHAVLSYAPSTAAVVDKAIAGLMDWKNAAALAAGAVLGPEVPAAYFGAQGTVGAAQGVKDIVQNGATPENVQNTLLNAATAVSAGAGGAAETPRSPAAAAARTAMGNLRDRAATGITEGVLGVTKRDRVHLADKAAIGKAALNEITASEPSAMLEQANAKIADLSQQLDDLATMSQKRTSLGPVREALENFMDEAERQSVPEQAKVVEKIQERLLRRPSGKAIPDLVTPSDILDLKRGIGKMKNWGTESEASIAAPIIDRVYGLLNDQLESAVPETGPINARLQAMIGVKDKAESMLNSPGVMQRAFSRLRAPTGALASSTGVGGAIGYAAGGPVGAAIGGTAGATVAPFAQEAISSPTAWIRVARAVKGKGNYVAPRIPWRMVPLSALLNAAAQGNQQ